MVEHGLVMMVADRSQAMSALRDRLVDLDIDVRTVGPQELLARLDDLHPCLLIVREKGETPLTSALFRMLGRRDERLDLRLLLLGDFAPPEDSVAATNRVVVCPPSTRTDSLVSIVHSMLLADAPTGSPDKVGEGEAQPSPPGADVGRIQKEYAEFVGKLSHEIRTPLGVIEGFTANLLDGISGELTGDQRDALLIVERNLHRLKEYLQDTLDTARLQIDDAAGDTTDGAPEKPRRREFRRRCLQVSEVLLEVLELFKESFKKKRVALEVDLSDSLPSIWMDPAKIRQVLINLLSNALKFTPADGRVLIRTSPGDLDPEQGRGVADRDEEAVEISVLDSGCGVDPELLPKLFKRVAPASAAAEGAGLGLSICREIVEEHKGSISAANLNEGGAIFSVVLPVDRRRRRPGSLLLCGDTQTALAALRTGASKRRTQRVMLRSPEEARRYLQGREADLLLLRGDSVTDEVDRVLSALEARAEQEREEKA